jgi:hypothetical protein
MKTKMTAAETAATKIKLLIEPYQKSEPLSSLKIQIGELLLFGDKEKKVFWPFFDAMLRRYFDLILVSKSGSERSGATN